MHTLTNIDILIRMNAYMFAYVVVGVLLVLVFFLHVWPMLIKHFRRLSFFFFRVKKNVTPGHASLSFLLHKKKPLNFFSLLLP